MGQQNQTHAWIAVVRRGRGPCPNRTQVSVGRIMYECQTRGIDPKGLSMQHGADEQSVYLIAIGYEKNRHGDIAVLPLRLQNVGLFERVEGFSYLVESRSTTVEELVFVVFFVLANGYWHAQSRCHGSVRGQEARGRMA